MDELDRIRTEYARRAADPRYRDWYAPTNAGNVFIEQERAHAIHTLLAAHPKLTGPHAMVLEVGCGAGSQLAEMPRYGVASNHLFGVDLLPERLLNGKHAHPERALTCADAQTLPYPANVFDVVTQFTMFTSVLDARVKQQIAREMLRVLKPQGAILWYDYRWNPTNRRTRGIEQPEIRALFPSCGFTWRRITLAPPLARWLAPRSRRLCALLHGISFLRTHYLVLIQP